MPDKRVVQSWPVKLNEHGDEQEKESCPQCGTEGCCACIACLLEISRSTIGSFDDSSVGAAGRGDEHSGIERNIVLKGNCIHSISEIKLGIVTRSLDKDHALIFLQNVNVCFKGNVVLEDDKSAVPDVDGHTLPFALEQEPVQTAGAPLDPIVREGSHGRSTVVQKAAISIIMIADPHIRTPDDDPLLRVKDRSNAREVAVPAPEVVVVIIDVIHRGGNNLTIRVHNPSAHLHMEGARDELWK